MGVYLKVLLVVVLVFVVFVVYAVGSCGCFIRRFIFIGNRVCVYRIGSNGKKGTFIYDGPFGNTIVFVFSALLGLKGWKNR